MQFKQVLSKWTQIAGLLLMGGAIAWTIKLGVIISTNGRIIDTGAAALFMKIGLFMLFLGSTGIGNRLSINRMPLIRIIAVILSPIAVAALLMVIGTFLSPLFKNSNIWYAQQEAPIAIAVIVNFIIGLVLYRSYKRVPQPA